MKLNLHTILVFFTLIVLSSCKKLEHNNGFNTFADVYFVNNSFLGANLGVKYKGEPIEWSQSTGSEAGKIHIVEGEAKFEFYDKSTGLVIAEKTVNVRAESPERYLVFQPSANAPIAFLDPNGQTSEAAPAVGYMKIKVANYAGDLLPYQEIDIIVKGLGDNGLEVLDTIESVGKNLENETYHLVKKGTSDIYMYRFSFLDHVTKAEVLNARETLYTSFLPLDPSTIEPMPQKYIFTLYLTVENLGPDFPTSRLKFGEDFYDIDPRVLFAN